ncbi:hypothetical protein GCM10010169_14900 [Micromonospora fulviviridis]|nr:hypothetical protein GCM10010169_14900 [Micromonospora fulviviridis]
MLSAPVDPGGARTNNSHTPAGPVHRVRAGPPGGAQSWAAIALALSTSGPGSGTKTVRR